MGAPAKEPQGVHCNAWVLGRDGDLMPSLVTRLAGLPAHKRATRTLIRALNSSAGWRPTDFDERTGHVARHGLVVVVGGGG